MATNLKFLGGLEELLELMGLVPDEIFVGILRKLDTESLMEVASVNREWFDFCTNDTVLRNRIEEEIEKEKKIDILCETKNTVEDFNSDLEMLLPYQQQDFVNSRRQGGKLATLVMYMAFCFEVAFIMYFSL